MSGSAFFFLRSAMQARASLRVRVAGTVRGLPRIGRGTGGQTPQAVRSLALAKLAQRGAIPPQGAAHGGCDGDLHLTLPVADSASSHGGIATVARNLIGGLR